MSFDFGPEMGLHILTYHQRQANRHYLANPGDLLTVGRGKISPKLCKKSFIQVRQRKRRVRNWCCIPAVGVIRDNLLNGAWESMCVSVCERRGRCVWMCVRVDDWLAALGSAEAQKSLGVKGGSKAAVTCWGTDRWWWWGCYWWALTPRGMHYYCSIVECEVCGGVDMDSQAVAYSGTNNLTSHDPIFTVCLTWL